MLIPFHNMFTTKKNYLKNVLYFEKIYIDIPKFIQNTIKNIPTL